MIRPLLVTILCSLLFVSEAAAQTTRPFEGTLRFLTTVQRDTFKITSWSIKGSKILRRCEALPLLASTMLIDTVTKMIYEYDSVVGIRRGSKLSYADFTMPRFHGSLVTTMETADIGHHPCRKYYILSDSGDTLSTIWAASWYPRNLFAAVARTSDLIGESELGKILDKGLLPVRLTTRGRQTDLIEVNEGPLSEAVFVLPKDVVYEDSMDSLRSMLAAVQKRSKSRIDELPDYLRGDPELDSHLPEQSDNFNGTITYLTTGLMTKQGSATRTLKFLGDKCILEKNYPEILTGKSYVSSTEAMSVSKIADFEEAYRYVPASDSIFHLKTDFRLSVSNEYAMIANLKTRKYLVINRDKDDTALTVWAAEWRPRNVARSLKRLRSDFGFETGIEVLLNHGLLPVRIINQEQKTQLARIDRSAPSPSALSMPDVKYEDQSSWRY